MAWLHKKASVAQTCGVSAGKLVSTNLARKFEIGIASKKVGISHEPREKIISEYFCVVDDGYGRCACAIFASSLCC